MHELTTRPAPRNHAVAGRVCDSSVVDPEEVSSTTILVVDDEDSIRDLICDAMSLAGHQTKSAAHGMEALRMLREEHVDLVILDVNMPGADGYEVLSRMRAADDRTPVIILTARQDKHDAKHGFELGADDFVRKPFGIEELVLRVSAILRRTSPAADSSAIEVGSIRLDAASHVVTCDGENIELSPTEYRLLATLMRNAGRLMTKEKLLSQVWGLDGSAETTVVESYVSYLRRKFGDRIVIRTVRTVGYQLLDPQAAS